MGLYYDRWIIDLGQIFLTFHWKINARTIFFSQLLFSLQRGAMTETE